MRKPTHPIRRMQRGLLVEAQHSPMPRLRMEQRIIARHVKPLLDLLEAHHPGPHYDCPTCRLLAAWRAPL